MSKHIGRPRTTRANRRVMMHLNLAPDVVEQIEARAAERGMAMSRVAEELVRAGMKAGQEGRRVGFSEVETERT